MIQQAPGGLVVEQGADGTVRVIQADDLIHVTGELAEQYGVKPPLDGRVTFIAGYTYDLSDWVGPQPPPGRWPGTYVGVRVEGEDPR